MVEKTIKYKDQMAIVPLLLSDDDKLRKIVLGPMAKFREELAKRLDAHLFKVEEVEELLGDSLTKEKMFEFLRPCVFLIYFLEDADLKGLKSPQCSLFSYHTCALSYFFYLPAVGSRPFKLKLEEMFLLNFGRPFHLYSVKDDMDTTLQNVMSSIQSTAPAICSLFGNNFEPILEFLTSKPCRILDRSFLRIFREDPSVTTFYACVEFMLMLVHTLCLLNASMIIELFGFYRNERTNEAGEIEERSVSFIRHSEIDANNVLAELLVKKTQLSDGSIIQLLQRQQKILQEYSPSHVFVTGNISSELANAIDTLTEALDLKSRFGKRINWMQVLQRMVEIRNATKGHGVIYSLDQSLVSIMVNLIVVIGTKLAELDLDFWQRIREKKITIESPMTRSFFCTLIESEKCWIKDNPIEARWMGIDFSLTPLILYSLDYGLFLFSGYSEDLMTVYYKNYSTGIYLSFDESIISDRLQTIKTAGKLKTTTQ